jgi:hypothetical protein
VAREGDGEGVGTSIPPGDDTIGPPPYLEPWSSCHRCFRFLEIRTKKSFFNLLNAMAAAGDGLIAIVSSNLRQIFDSYFAIDNFLSSVNYE